MKRKKIVISIVALLIAAGAIGGGWWWHQHKKDATDDVVVYVSTVAELNAANPDLSTMCFGGITEAQETKKIKVDTTKTISEIFVKEGEQVKKGTPLFQYDVEAMQLDLEQGQIQVEQMQNEISSYEEQIRQLESEKAKADADQQISYTTQIQTLQTSISKAEYEIKVKNVELQKQQKAIDNANVLADMDGVVNTVKTPEALQAEGSDVLLTITASGNYRIKGILSEQQLGQIVPGQNVIVRSRVVKEQYWTGTVIELGTEAEKDDNNDMVMMDGGSNNTASKYPFYIELKNADGLLLGQHVLIEPDIGQSDARSGIWIYADYLIWEDEKAYVWTTDDKNRLHKQQIETGASDEDYGIIEIKSGLSGISKIAYPAEDYKNGMKTTTNIKQANEIQEDISEDDAFYEDMPEGDLRYDDEELMPELDNAADDAIMQ